MKTSFLDKFIERLDRVDPGELQHLLTRLVEERGLLENVFEALQEGVLLIDPEGEVSYLNRAACDFFGLKRESVRGQALGTVVRGVNWSELLQQKKAVSRDIEVYYPEHRFLNFYLAPISDGEGAGEVPGFVVLVRDITQSRRMTEEMVESEKMTAFTMLAAGMAHELGNPLNSLNIHLQLLRRKLAQLELAQGAELTDLVEVAGEEVERLDLMVKQFLSAVRPTRPQFEITDLNVVLSDAVHFLAAEFQQQGVSVKQELHAGLPMLQLDAGQMKQAFFNLLRNALQAIEGKGEVVVRTDLDGDDVVEISVADDGKGISKEDMGSLFQPYYSTKAQGTGLGLLIVRRIVREHGGEISLESEEGEGAKVRVRLPLAQRAPRLLGHGAEGKRAPQKKATQGGGDEVIEIKPQA
ncbi:MAG: ATP-binding protein [Verrucomicrobiota bacterium]